jgi:hypothetical protein
MQHALDRFLSPGWSDSKKANGCDSCDIATDEDQPYRSWRFKTADGSLETRIFCPPASRSEILAMYPDDLMRPEK